MVLAQCSASHRITHAAQKSQYAELQSSQAPPQVNVETSIKPSRDQNASKTCWFPEVSGCVITGNEDGIKHWSMEILYSLQHLGYVIPPQAD